MQNGLLAAALAYIVWGLFPLYFHQLSQIGAFELVLHRTLWALGFLLLVLTWRRQWQWLREAWRKPRLMALYATSATLLSVNWLIYVWAVNNQHVLEASLGYFINPLVNVLLGVLVLRERPRPAQWAALTLAAGAVLWLSWHTGAPPWIALSLALSFGVYGLIKKTAPLDALEGLTLETLLLAVVAAPVLLGWDLSGRSALAGAPASLWAWLLLAGPLTAVPLLLFGHGARRIPLSTLGLLQYISPSLQFLLGVWLFHEPLQATRLTGFALIWLALLLYSGESLWRARQLSRAT
ncbi:EamA family transporter RarD [Ideonella dechloratans]|uniref:EamA family transporter RarD n=1 Tax=Ideonella dechloratans TaxID=36863 RepID=UPI0035B076B0